MKTDTHDDADHAKRIVAAISDDERQRLGALMQRRDDALRAAAAGLADVTAIKDRTISEVRGRLAASRARLYGEPKRTRKRKLTLTGAARQAKRVAIEVKRFDLHPDGTISLITGTPAETGDNAARTPDDELTQWRKKRNAR